MSDDLSRPTEANIEPGQLWELWSPGEKQWVRLVVSRIEDGLVTLRYQAVFEFVTVDLWAMQDAERFRPAKGC
jgi:hypothetical protein